MNRKFMILPILAALLSGCASNGTTVLSDGTHTKVFSPCDNTAICFADNLYDISWDRSRADYPVTYRAKQYEFQSNRTEYVYQQYKVIER